MILILGEQRHRNLPEAALDRDEDRGLLAAPDDAAIRNLPGALSGGEEAAEGQGEGEVTAAPVADNGNLRLSYFAAWFLVLLLMLVGSIVAISAVSAGGRLVLYDTDIRQLSRAIVKEVRRNKGR